MKRWAIIAALLLCGGAWADIPSTGYATVQFTLSGSVTDFTLKMDIASVLADLSAGNKAAWVADWNTNSNGYGRACKSDGTTEIATDWIGLDYATETGQVSVMFSGTNAAGTYTIRLWPPNSGRTLYAAGDTYGQYASYSAYAEASYSVGGGSDRTDNARNATAKGGVTFGGSTGKIGLATDYDGTDDYAQLVAPGNTAFSFLTSFTVMAWVQPDAFDQYDIVFGNVDNAGWGWRLWSLDASSYKYSVSFRDSGGSKTITGTTAISTDGTTWQHVAIQHDGTNGKLYVNGASEGTPTAVGNVLYQSAGGRSSLSAIGAMSNVDAGTSAYRFLNGRVSDMYIYSTALSAAHIAEEHAQTNNNASYYTAGYVSVGGKGLPVIERLFIACADN